MASASSLTLVQRYVVEPVAFLRRYFAEPTSIGAVVPSSRWLVEALTAPVAARSEPASILEVGAGTGSVTRRLAALLGPEDRLDICEVDPTFVRILEKTLLSSGPLALARREGRVRLLHCPLQEIDTVGRYDYVISGLPLTAFARREVKAVLETIRLNLRPGGVFSYFEYVGLRRLARLSPRRRSRRRVRAVSRLLDQQIRDHQVARRTVVRNLPPAHARHWRFETSITQSGQQPVESGYRHLA